MKSFKAGSVHCPNIRHAGEFRHQLHIVSDLRSGTLLQLEIIKSKRSEIRYIGVFRYKVSDLRTGTLEC